CFVVVWCCCVVLLLSIVVAVLLLLLPHLSCCHHTTHDPPGHHYALVCLYSGSEDQVKAVYWASQEGRCTGLSYSSSYEIFSVEVDEDEERQPLRNNSQGATSPCRNKQQELENGSHAPISHQKNNGGAMDSGQGGSDGHQVEILRQENEEVKQRLANLQHEFSLLEDQVQMLVAERRMVEEQQRVEKEAQEQAYISKLQQYQATIAALDHCNTTLAEDPPIPQTKVIHNCLVYRIRIKIMKLTYGIL
ncbi:hypothetical protein OTU49_001843, partial [Cherax quadricarinatus]